MNFTQAIISGVLGGAAGLGIDYYSKQKATRDKLAQSAEVAKTLGASIQQLRTKPSLLDNYQDRFIKVGLIVRNRDPDEEPQEGQLFYNSFLIDKDSDIIDIEKHFDDPAVEENAKWLARQLNIPFESN